jgi:hypothetical protein
MNATAERRDRGLPLVSPLQRRGPQDQIVSRQNNLLPR